MSITQLEKIFPLELRRLRTVESCLSLLSFFLIFRKPGWLLNHHQKEYLRGDDTLEEIPPKISKQKRLVLMTYKGEREYRGVLCKSVVSKSANKVTATFSITA